MLPICPGKSLISLIFSNRSRRKCKIFVSMPLLDGIRGLLFGHMKDLECLSQMIKRENIHFAYLILKIFGVTSVFYTIDFFAIVLSS